MTKLVLLGTGNVASHLFDAFFNSEHVVVVQVYNRSEPGLDYFLKKTKVTSSLDELEPADIYLICVKDDAIEKVAQRIPYKDKLIAHTSGSLPLLDVSQKNGVFYPLQTFSKDSMVDLKNIPFCLEASDENSFEQLRNLAKNISEKSFTISTEQRKSLHLAAVFVCNFTNHLYSIGEEISNKNNVPFEILHALITETARKATENSPEKVQTGPAIRNDNSTVDGHLSQLENTTYQQIYTLLTQSIKKNHGTEL